jgi:hypothetical protein
MSRTIKFVLIVTLVSGATSFLLAALGARSGQSSPPFIGTVFGMVAGIVYLLLTNNRKVPVADADTRRRALADIAPADGSARVLVVRQVMVGVMIGVDVVVDGTLRTQLKSPRFAVLPLEPGRHEIVAVAQGRSTKPLALDLVAGETAVVRISAGLGGVKLTQEPDTAALRASLAKVPMVETLKTVSG